MSSDSAHRNGIEAGWAVFKCSRSDCNPRLIFLGSVLCKKTLSIALIQPYLYIKQPHNNYNYIQIILTCNSYDRIFKTFYYFISYCRCFVDQQRAIAILSSSRKSRVISRDRMTRAFSATNNTRIILNIKYGHLPNIFDISAYPSSEL